jgi:hypothetical protein
MRFVPTSESPFILCVIGAFAQRAHAPNHKPFTSFASFAGVRIATPSVPPRASPSVRPRIEKQLQGEDLPHLEMLERS